MAFGAVAFYYDCCSATPPTRHYISLTRNANTYEMHEWIVIPGMPGFLDVCMHCCLYVCIDAFCVIRTRFCGLRTFMKCMWIVLHEASELTSKAYDLCFGAPEVGSDASELSSEA